MSDLWQEVSNSSPFLRDLPMTKIAGNNLLVGDQAYPLDCLIGDAEVSLSLSNLSGISEEGIKNNAVKDKAISIGKLYSNFIVNGNKYDSYGTYRDRVSFIGLKDLVLSNNIFKINNISELHSILDKEDYDFILVNSKYLYEKLNLKQQQLGIRIYSNNHIFDEFIPEDIWQKCRQWLSNKIKWIKPCDPNYTTIYIGKFDNGTATKGIGGIYGGNEQIFVEDIGVHSSRDAKIYRVKSYLGLACYNKEDVVAVKVKIN